MTAVLPTYGHRASMDAAVESVLSQPIGELDLIVVDDASDQPVRLDRAVLADPRVRLARREVNGGVAAAQNTGVALARGEHVAFVHSDDRWLPTKVEHQLAVLERAGAGAAAAESATLRTGPGGDRTVGPRLAGRTYEDLLSRRVTDLHVGGFLFRRDALVELGGFDEDLRAYEDLDLLIRLCRGHDVVFSEEVVAEIDVGGADRLGDSPWMQHAREHLIAKYEADLLTTFGGLPPGWRDWSFQAALSALDSGQPARARHHLRRSLGRGWAPRARRAPLLAATFAGPRAGRLVGRVHGRVVDRRARRRWRGGRS